MSASTDRETQATVERYCRGRQRKTSTPLSLPEQLHHLPGLYLKHDQQWRQGEYPLPRPAQNGTSRLSGMIKFNTKWEECTESSCFEIFSPVRPSSAGRCLGDHSWRDRGGSDQVYGLTLFGRLPPVWQRSFCKRHQQVRITVCLLASALSTSPFQLLLQDWEPSDARPQLHFAQ